MGVGQADNIAEKRSGDGMVEGKGGGRIVGDVSAGSSPEKPTTQSKDDDGRRE